MLLTFALQALTAANFRSEAVGIHGGNAKQQFPVGTMQVAATK